MSWQDYLKEAEPDEENFVTVGNSPVAARWWNFNDSSQNLCMNHPPTSDFSGLGYSNLYAGRQHSTFSWHVEPADIPSCSVVRAGSARLWYTINSKYTSAVKDFVWENLKDTSGHCHM